MSEEIENRNLILISSNRPKRIMKTPLLLCILTALTEDRTVIIYITVLMHLEMLFLRSSYSSVANLSIYTMKKHLMTGNKIVYRSVPNNQIPNFTFRFSFKARTKKLFTENSKLSLRTF